MTRMKSEGMTMEKITTSDAPAALGPYSQGIKANGFVFTAGQIPVNPATGEIPATIEEQAHQSLKNVKAILDASGPVDVVSVTVYMTNIKDFGKVNEIYGTYFSEPFPARSCVEVSNLPKGVMIEIAAVAVTRQ